MKNALVRLRENLETLNPAEHAVAEVILEDPEQAATYSIHALAEKAFVSTTAVIRLSRALGFSGYREFRENLKIETALQAQEKTIPSEDIAPDDSATDLIRKITHLNMQSLQETEKLLDPDVLTTCAQLLHSADEVLLFGLGASNVAARDMYLKLVRINKKCSLDSDWHTQLLHARNSSKKDVAVVFSYSGQTNEIITCMEALRDNGTPIIAVTRPIPSPVFDLANYHLFTTSTESLYRTGAMASRICTLNIIDILYSVYCVQDYDEIMKSLRKTHIDK